MIVTPSQESQLITIKSIYKESSKHITQNENTHETRETSNTHQSRLMHHSKKCNYNKVINYNIFETIVIRKQGNLTNSPISCIKCVINEAI